MSKRYLDFEVIKEVWSVYELQDGTKIKILCMLDSVRNVKERERSMAINQRIVALCDESVCGKPAKKRHTPEQIHQSIEMAHCDYTTLRYEPSEYILDDNTRIVVHHNVVSIARTRLFDQNGDRIYEIEAKGNFTISPSKN